jgi:hypothetical protein
VKDTRRTFLIRYTKLFDGTECLRGKDLVLSYPEFHRNEKLRRVQTNGDIPALPGFDVDKPPFVRDSSLSPGLVTLTRRGASVLVSASPHPRLVRTATQQRSTTNREEIVRFVVPAAGPDPNAPSNRFWTSHDIVPTGLGRAAPEYVNIRHRVTTAASGSQTLEDLIHCHRRSLRI